MAKSNQTKVGDKVHTDGWTRKGTVKKVKPDGTRVVKDQTGKVRQDKDPIKAS